MKWVIVDDRMQSGYRYEVSARMGRDFHPEFKPELAPAEMLALGVFCGKYMTDTRKEFPSSWFNAPSCRQPVAIARSTTLVSTPASPSPNGARKAGSFQKTRADGSSGIAGITSAAESRMRIGARSNAGKHFIAISIKSKGTVNQEIHFAARVSGRHCCTGRMTVAHSNINAELRSRGYNEQPNGRADCTS